MKHVVLYSGGVCSSYVAYLVAQQNRKEDVIFLHTPTYTEHEDADRFRDQVAEFIGIPYVDEADGRDVWKVIDDENCLPSDRIPFCTRILKLEPRLRFLKRLNEDYTLYYGFDLDEYLRAQNVSTKAEIYKEKVSFPLIDKMIRSNELKKIITREWKICLPEPYLYLEHNNCIPCWKSQSEKYWYSVWKQYPDRYWKAHDKEKKIGHTVFPNKVTLADMAKKFEKVQEPSLLPGHDFRPCLCSF